MRLQPGRTPARILEILEAHQPEWLTPAAIEAEILDRFGDAVSEDAISRAIHRLANAGHLQTRLYPTIMEERRMENPVTPFGENSIGVYKEMLEVSA